MSDTTPVAFEPEPYEFHESDVPGFTAPRDEEWVIEVDHSSYYRQEPIADGAWEPWLEEAKAAAEEAAEKVRAAQEQIEEGEENADTTARLHELLVEAEQAMAVFQERSDSLTDSYFPGYKMIQRLIEEPTTSTTVVNVNRLRQIRRDQRANPRTSVLPHHENLARELEQQGWRRQFPIESITAIRCEANPEIAERLTQRFFSQEDDDE